MTVSESDDKLRRNSSQAPALRGRCRPHLGNVWKGSVNHCTVSSVGAETMHRARIGILGGTFDPIHHVHLLMAREAAHMLNLDVVLFVPVGQSAHRDSAHVAGVGHRCAMVTAAIREEPRFAISMVDVKRPKPTYTYDTLHDLRDTYGVGTDFFFIVGTTTWPAFRNGIAAPN